MLLEYRLLVAVFFVIEFSNKKTQFLGSLPFLCWLPNSNE